MGVRGACPPGNFANLVSLKWHFLHFDIIFVVFFKVLDSKRWINNSKEKLKNICDKNKQGDFFYLFRNGHLEKNMKNCKLTTRHKFIQWGATLVWALLYSLHAALHFDNRFLEGLNL